MIRTRFADHANHAPAIIAGAFLTYLLVRAALLLHFTLEAHSGPESPGSAPQSPGSSPTSGFGGLKLAIWTRFNGLLAAWFVVGIVAACFFTWLVKARYKTPVAHPRIGDEREPLLVGPKGA